MISFKQMLQVLKLEATYPTQRDNAGHLYNPKNEVSKMAPKNNGKIGAGSSGIKVTDNKTPVAVDLGRGMTNTSVSYDELPFIEAEDRTPGR